MIKSGQKNSSNYYDLIRTEEYNTTGTILSLVFTLSPFLSRTTKMYPGTTDCNGLCYTYSYVADGMRMTTSHSCFVCFKPALAGNVGICVCRLHPPNAKDRHLYLSQTCRKCRPNTLKTFCYVGHFFSCWGRVREFTSQQTFLHVVWCKPGWATV